MLIPISKKETSIITVSEIVGVSRWLTRTVRIVKTGAALVGAALVTHPRIFDPSSSIGTALEFATKIREQPNCISLVPGRCHWDIFVRFCRDLRLKGNLVADAYLAALTIEKGSEWISTDRDYTRFPGLRWRHPLA